MHRIDSTGATAGNLFTEGDPTQGVPATVVDAEWLNGIQEEIVKIIEESGLTLDKGTQDQLYTAVVRNGGRVFSSYTELRAFDFTRLQNGAVVFVASRASFGDGGSGPFRWDSSDLSAEVANDEVTTGEGDGGIYVAPDNDKTGGSGAYVREGIKRGGWYGSELQTIKVTSGNRSVPVSSRASAKPSDVYWNVDLGDNYQTSSENQTPRIFHVEGVVPDQADHSGQSFIHAYSFHLTSQETTADMGEVRGLKGTVVGDGGNSTMRAAHVVAEGKNGFTGVLTGIMGTADYTDQTDGENNNVGQGVGVRGQVGAGCMANFQANAFASEQRPSYAYMIDTGTNPVLPEVACYHAHGGGNGSLFRGVRDQDNIGEVIFDVDNKARVTARSFYSGRRTISVGSTFTIDIPNDDGDSGMIEVLGINNTSTFGKAYYRTNSNNSVVDVYKGANTSFTTGQLDGSTGTDGDMTVGVRSDGKIDIENRTGGTLTVMWHFIAPAKELGEVN